jgi:hypothetical protein
VVGDHLRLGQVGLGKVGRAAVWQDVAWFFLTRVEMKRMLLLAAVAALFVADAQAFGRRVRVAPTATPTAAPAYQSAPLPPGRGGSVQWKADVQARSGRMFHPGGGFVAGASYEGVGYSSASPEQALAMCCYSNSGMPVVAQAVSRGPNGYYAVKQYAPGPVRTAVGGTLQSVGAAIHQVGTLTLPSHTTVYRPDWNAPAPATTPYPPIQLRQALPTCAGGNCGR